MKKKYFPLIVGLSAVIFWSCNDNSTSTADDSDSINNMNAQDSINRMNDTASNTMAPINTTPLTKMDSSFVMEAAVGGIMEVEAGNLAAQNAINQRVKDFAAMMVRDHTRANDELKTLAASHGIAAPASLPADKQKHIDAMKSMTGKSFDQHYVNMMVDDHEKAVAKFKKAAEKCDDAALKTWASSTLPTLQAHLDSIKAIKKSKL